MRIIAVIQARMGSRRFPGKMLVDLSGKPVIWHVVNRVRQSKRINGVILATCNGKDNEVLIEEVKKYGLDYFIGDENDVLDRFYQCAKKFHIDVIVRITGDCPLVDPTVIDGTIQLFEDNKLDYASNVLPPTYPDGFDVEVFSFSALERAWKEAKLKSEREHVTPYIWKNTKIFKRKTLKNNTDLSNIRLTLDEKEDLIVINNVLRELGSYNFKLDDIMRVIKRNPELISLNKVFKRNEGYKKSLEEDAK